MHVLLAALHYTTYADTVTGWQDGDCKGFAFVELPSVEYSQHLMAAYGMVQYTTTIYYFTILLHYYTIRLHCTTALYCVSILFLICYVISMKN